MKTLLILSVLALSGAVDTGCSLINATQGTGASASGSSASLVSSPSGVSGSSSSSGSSGASASIQSASVPTAPAVEGRLLKALTDVTPTSTNYKKVLAQVQANLPNTPDPTEATGLEQIPLLVYAACSDAKATDYGVNTSQSISAQTTNLVNAGVTMINANLAGLASNTAVNSQVVQVLTDLVNQDAAVSGTTTAMTFVSVCLAANSFAIGMTGF